MPFVLLTLGALLFGAGMFGVLSPYSAMPLGWLAMAACAVAAMVEGKAEGRREEAAKWGGYSCDELLTLKAQLREQLVEIERLRQRSVEHDQEREAFIAVLRAIRAVIAAGTPIFGDGGRIVAVQVPDATWLQIHAALEEAHRVICGPETRVSA